MTLIVSVLRFALAEFGPLIALLLLKWSFGVEVATAGTVIFVLVDGARKTGWRIRRRPLTLRFARARRHRA